MSCGGSLPCKVVQQQGCCSFERPWSLQDIVRQLLSTPRTQLSFYVSDMIHPSQQNELLSYRSSARQGVVTRQVASNIMRTAAETVDPKDLYATIANDLRLPIVQRAFFTYISSPGPFALYAPSENHDPQQGFQQLMPISTRFLTA